MIEIRSLSKTFRQPRQKQKKLQKKDPREEGRLFHAVREVSFTTEAGSIVGLLGPNGAGKTTLLRMLSTALRPTSGTARFHDLDIVERPLEVRAKIGFLSGNTGLYTRLTAREMIRYFGRLYGLSAARANERIEHLTTLLDMGDFIDKRNGSLSSGMRQKVSIARTLVHDPEIIIFDEPTTGLDVAAAEAILECLETFRSEGKSVLFSTHNMHEVERLCDKIAIVSLGKLCFEGTVDEMLAGADCQRLDKAFLFWTDQGKETAHVA